ncbi:Checkpoint kinase 2 [Coelomomyces lativittatus]|nr:Checkpoint kinase 2 [Coelomomyces lativittatus]
MQSQSSKSCSLCSPLSMNDFPKSFLCPISLEIMNDPVVIQCGHTFEKNSLIKWLKEQVVLPDENHESYSLPQSPNFCPVCKAVIDDSIMIPCFTIKSAINDWKEERWELQKKMPSNISEVNPESTENLANNDDANRLCYRIEATKVQTRERPVMKLLRLKWRLGSHKKKEIIPTNPSQISNQTQVERHPNTNKSPSTSTVINETTLASTLSSTFARINEPPFASDEKTELEVPVWAALVPLLPIHTPIRIDRDSFYVGRHSACHARVYLSEVSSKHFNISRQKRSDGLYQVYIEDCSTNGTFVNGQSIGRGHIKALYPGYEISIGRKFNGRREFPEVRKFIDRVIVDVQTQQPEIVNDPQFLISLEKLNEIQSFIQLLSLTDPQPCALLNMPSSLLCCTLMSAIHSWKHENRFPVYVFEVNSTACVTDLCPAPSTNAGFGPLDDAMVNLRLELSLIPVLHKWFPTLSKDVLSLIVHYEQKKNPSASTDQLLCFCSEKIKDHYGLNMNLNQDEGKIANPSLPPVIALPSHPISTGTCTQNIFSSTPTSITPSYVPLPLDKLHFVLKTDSNGRPWLVPVVLPATINAPSVPPSSNEHGLMNPSNFDSNKKEEFQGFEEKEDLSTSACSILFPSSISSTEHSNLHATA